MSRNLHSFGLELDSSLPGPTSRSYRPPSWPPPKDWVCIEDKAGNAISSYGDSVWKLWPWTENTETFNFFDGPKLRVTTDTIDPANAELLRQLFVWRGWGARRAIRPGTLISFGKRLRRVILACSKNKILASNLSRYPAVIDEVAKYIAPSTYDDTIADLERIRVAHEFLGFELLDEWGLQRLKALQPTYKREQTEYIPPRIWNYVVTRLGESIDDYLKHQQKIEECFAFCMSAYENNKIMEYRSRTGKQSKNTPFQTVNADRNGRYSGYVFLGPFEDTAQRFGIRNVIDKWVGNSERKFTIQMFAKYLNMVQFSGMMEVAAFTLMRIEELSNLRMDCLVWHGDPVYGQIPLIQAETTKTDQDDKALWITSPSVDPAIRAMTSIAKLRLFREGIGIGAKDDNPYLISNVREPWASNGNPDNELKVRTSCNSRRLGKYPKLLDPHLMSITEKDIKIAKTVCPTLNSDLFKVGKPWPLAWHQFRRTGAVNMFASGEVSDSTIQLQMKHLTRCMSLYYGRGNSSLHLNDKVRVLLVNAQYEAMGRQMAEVLSDQYVSPYGGEHKAKLLASVNNGNPVNLISDDDARHYENAARKHQINFRLTVLGGCMKNGPCDGDCVSSIGDCSGGAGKSPCSNVLFDRNRAEANQIRLDGVIKQLEATPTDTPRYRHLEQERRGLENYFAYIK